IVGVKNEHQQIELADQVVEQSLSVRALEDAIHKLNEQKQPIVKKEKVKRQDPFIDHVETELREKFKTSVKIKQQKNKGKIELEYYSKQDLERILELLQV